MGDKNLRRKSQHLLDWQTRKITPCAWWYEEPAGIAFATPKESYLLPWRQIRESLARKDKAAK